MGLRPLLLGSPLSDKENDRTLVALRAHLDGLCELLPKVYGTSPAARQANSELEQIAQLPAGASELACMRAALLFGLYKEGEVKRHFAEQEAVVGATFAKDMAERVLPFVAPRFLKHSCQAPEAFVMTCLVLSEMWAGEKLGNWPLTTMAPVGS